MKTLTIHSFCHFRKLIPISIAVFMSLVSANFCLAGPYDGSWSVSFTNSVASSGGVSCGLDIGNNGFSIDAGNMSGTIKDSQNNSYQIVATVANNGRINNGAYAYMSTSDIVVFSGSFSGSSGSGQWQDFYGCNGSFTASQTWANPSETIDTTTSYYDGAWSGTATSSTSYAGDTFCDNATVSLNVSNGQISGTATNNYYGTVLSVTASVNAAGSINNGAFAFGGDDAATFDGSLSNLSGSGNWVDIYGCTGTWSVSRSSAPNRAPVAHGGSLIITEDTLYSGTLSAEDSDGDSLVFSITSLPTNGTLELTNVNTGTFTYNPKANYSGSDNFSFKVSDRSTDSAIKTINLVVNPVNDAPSVDAGTNKVIIIGAAASFDDAGATDPDNDSLQFSWSLTSNPQGSTNTSSDISHNSTSKAFATFTPNSKGEYTLTLAVHDSIAPAQTDTVKLTVIESADFDSDKNLDVDGDGDADANDGLMIQRRLTGAGTVITGIVLPTGVGGYGEAGARSNVEIVGAIDSAGLGYNIDSDSDADANDGLMLQRRLTGAGTVITGIVLPTGVGGSGNNGAKSNSEIVSAIDNLKPDPNAADDSEPSNNAM